LLRAHRSAEFGEAELGEPGLGEMGDAEAAMLVALRCLILRHADVERPARAGIGVGSGRRMAVYRGMIEDDPGARFDLGRFAAASGVTRFQVIRDFKQVTGLTPSAFIRDRRVRAAGRLIQRGETLANAAMAAGFADQSHLTRAFKLARGFTPGMLRRALAG
jgi:AraC-like DNA-binding protein